jgi:RNA polymerase sigma-70 factor (ECF subfamily)
MECDMSMTASSRGESSRPGDLAMTGEAERTRVFVSVVHPLLGAGFALAVAMLGDRDAAEDAVQEAAIKAWRHADKAERPGRSSRPWFLAIVANQCRDMRRAPWQRVIRMGQLPERAAPDRIDRIADEMDVRRALGRLSADQRAILLLRYRLDMPVAEIAQVMSLRPGTAKSRLHRALRAIKSHVDHEPGSMP